MCGMTKNYFELLTPLLYGLSAPKRNLEPFHVPLRAPSSLTPTRSQVMDLVTFGFQARTSYRDCLAQIAADLVLSEGLTLKLVIDSDLLVLYSMKNDLKAYYVGSNQSRVGNVSGNDVMSLVVYK